MARSAIKFVKDRNLITVPPLCEETWRLTMVSPEGQKTLPYAAYGGQNMMVAYAKDEMKHEDKLMSMRGNNRHFTRIVTAHELIPGHHLQRFVADRNRAYRSIFSTPLIYPARKPGTCTMQSTSFPTPTTTARNGPGCRTAKAQPTVPRCSEKSDVPKLFQYQVDSSLLIHLSIGLAVGFVDGPSLHPRETPGRLVTGE